ncbi:hypothetical protein C2G38_675593 [Gigaspora rosea]|uniref:Uncharacterized protein n=1 Tax=Gigaspora rosea TaxID=44941 RepID=A0A397UBH8_9GLOM|nr:hypothetical protein C2G38_675593 [Gigaspora rosea]
MPTTNSNIVKTISNPNRFSSQPGGGLMNMSVVNPAQQVNRLGTINSVYPPTSMPQRTAGTNPLIARNGGRIASWNYTPGSSLVSQSIPSRQNFTSYPNSIHSVHPTQTDLLDMSEFPALGSTNAASNNASASGLGSSYANTAQIGTNSVLNDNRPLHQQQPPSEFTIDDFPALPGASNNVANRGVVGSQPVSHHLVNHQPNSMDGLNNGNNISTGLSASGIQESRMNVGVRIKILLL